MTSITGRRALCVATMILGLSLTAACSGGGAGGGEGGDVGGSIAENYDLTAEQELNQAGGGDVSELTVGSKNFFVEQEILGHIALQALEAAGAEVVDRTGLGDTQTVRSSLLSGGIDLYWGYTGTGAVIHLAQTDVPKDPQSVYEQVARTDREQNDIVWLKPAPANNSYAIAVREEVSDQSSDEYDPQLARVESISDLKRLAAQHPGKATLCVGPEFDRRADTLSGLERQYGFKFRESNVFVFPVSTVYGAVDAGQRCNFGSVFRTNGHISELGLRLLEDDQGAFPPYNPSVSMRQSTLERYPDLKPLFNDISSRLDAQTLRELNRKVGVGHQTPEAVAKQWLQQEGLVTRG